MINKTLKKKKNNNLLNILFQSNNFYGDLKKKTKKDIYPFIYGIRHKYSIINLKYIKFFLQRSIYLINYFIKKKQNILIIGNTKDISFLLKNNFIKNNKNIILFNEKWINGFLTNESVESFIKKKKINLIITLKVTTNKNFFFKEIYNSKIPLVACINTNQSIKYIDYPIIINNKNLKSVFLIMYLIRKIF